MHVNSSRIPYLGQTWGPGSRGAYLSACTYSISSVVEVATERLQSWHGATGVVLVLDVFTNISVAITLIWFPNFSYPLISRLLAVLLFLRIDSRY